MPAVMIRQLDALAKVAEYTSTDEQREVIAQEAEKIMRLSEESVSEAADRAAVLASHAQLLSGNRDRGQRNRRAAAMPEEG
jgi:uncharacterized membrane protein